MAIKAILDLKKQKDVSDLFRIGQGNKLLKVEKLNNANDIWFFE